jgi:hypothetical protein
MIAMRIAVFRAALAVFGLAVLSCAASAAEPAASKVSPASCANVNFLAEGYLPDQTGTLDTDGYRAIVMNHGLQVFAGPTGDTQIAHRLNLRDRVRIRQITGAQGPLSLFATRVRIEDGAGQDSIGWVDATDLLCRHEPLTNASGMEVRAYVKTADALANTAAAVTAYPRSTGTACDGNCTELQSFQLYFVFDRHDGRQLLGEDYTTGSDRVSIVGWVDDKHVLDWPTGIGLRPREDLKWTDPDGKEEEGTVCAFASREQAIAHRDRGAEDGCQPVLGGDSWFALPLRMALLETKDGIHKVATHATGLGQGSRVADTSTGTTLMVDPRVTKKGEDDQKRFGDTVISLKRADVFFLIDGTESMSRMIDTIRGTPDNPGVVDRIVSDLRDEVLEGFSLRYGFRIYGDTSQNPDSPFGTTGLGDGLALSAACGKDAVGNDEAAFKARFQTVQVHNVVPTEPLEDYAENVNGGIRQALTDLAACPKQLKLLFVFGDNGYNPAKQRARGFEAVTADELIRDGHKRFGDRLRVIFVQPPRDDAIGNQVDYQRAYELFTTQANDFVRRFYGGTDAGPAVITMERDGRVAIPYERLADTLTSSVGEAAQARVIDEIAIRIRSGESVRKAIEKTKANFPTAPGWFYDLVSKESCAALGAQCDNDVFQAVPTLYITQDPKRKGTPDLISDLWLKQEDLSRWITFLDGFSKDEPGPDGRKRMALAAVEAISEINKVRAIDAGETYQEFFGRTGFFKDALNTPLLRYSPDDLINPEKVQPCEFDRLRFWALAAKSILQIAQSGGQRPVFKTEFGPSGDCPLSAKGKAIPIVRDPPQSIGLAPGVKGASFGHAVKGGKIYWMPKDYLP